MSWLPQGSGHSVTTGMVGVSSLSVVVVGPGYKAVFFIWVDLIVQMETRQIDVLV